MRRCGPAIRWHALAVAAIGSLTLLAAARGSGAASPALLPRAGAAATSPPQIRHEAPASATSVEGLIRLDVTVTDQSGKVVQGLQRSAFRVLDNGQPRPVVAFREAGDTASAAKDPTSIIILLDTLDLDPGLAHFERHQTEQFLRQNEQLAEPVTIYTLDDTGFYLAAKPSTSAEALTEALESNSRVEALFVPPHGSQQFKTAVVDGSFLRFPPFTGLQALATIAAEEDHHPGRKLLLWVGPGLRGNGTGAYLDQNYYLRTGKGRGYAPSDLTNRKGREDIFQKIVWFSTLLRQSRIRLDTFSVGEQNFGLDYVQNGAKESGATKARSSWTLAANAWKKFLTGAPSAQQAPIMDLYKKVLAIESGGQVLPPDNNLAQEMSGCIRNASSFYTLTFDPSPAARADEYHTLQVTVAQPDLSTQTGTGYYDEPFYDDRPDPAIRRVTVAQLEEIVRGHKRGEIDPASLELTERLSRARLRALSSELRGKEARERLRMIADESAFLDLPASEMTPNPAPDAASQQKIIASALDFLDRVIPRLPDFFAMRSGTYYYETDPFLGFGHADAKVPLHPEERSTVQVLYRHGSEIQAPVATRGAAEADPLDTYGTFGPMLVVLEAALKMPGAVTWSGWQATATGKGAVFRYQAAGTPRIDLTGCCFPDPDFDGRISIHPDYHGEVVIDPASGALFRASLQSELPEFVPARRSDTMVSYGPVTVGGRTYILPTRSVSIWRGRTIQEYAEFMTSFGTWGPYQTKMNVFAFGHYHEFRGSAYILPGVQQ